MATEDITGREQMDRALRESEERYRHLVEASHDWVWEVDENSRFTFAGPQVREILGYEPEEMLGKTPLDLMPPDEAALFRAVFAPLSATRQSFRRIETTNRHKDGHLVVLEATGVPVFDENGRFRGYRGMDRDITERRRTEKLLEDEIARRRLLVDQSTDGIVVLDQDGAVCEANQQYARMLGYSMEELYGLHVWHWDAQFTREQLLEMLSAVDEKGAHIETRHRRKDGTLLEVEISTNGAVSQGKKFIFCVCRDITERKRVEEAIRGSERLLRQAEAVANLGSYELDIDAGSWTSSEMLDALFGIDKAYQRSVDGWLELIHPDDRAMMADYFAGEVLGRGRPFDKEYRVVRHSDGVASWVHGLGRLEFDGQGRPVKMLGTIQDITERRQAKEALTEREEQLRQSQKMEAVGQLAGGIAHDFNNLLAAILGYADLLLGNSKLTDGAARADLAEIKRAGERASALTRQILAFSRRQALQPRVTSLNEVLRQIEPLLRRTIGEDIDLVTHLEPGLALVEVDPHQFEQVLTNLVLNARDAMPSGGRLTVETANVELNAEFSRTHAGATPGSYVMVRVSDTGVGMDESVKERIFEPFFTTKAVGQGTGLGLSTVYGIIKQSQGFIFAESETDKGTSMEIYLPRSTEAAMPSDPVDPPGDPPGGPPSGTGTIMVVEDEPSLRRLIQRVLGGVGYAVLTFASGQEALDALGTEECRVDMLLTDVMLPGGLQGHDLAGEVLALCPGLPVLYMSGYSRDALVHAGRLDQGVNLLEKPFTGETLTTAVRTVLERARRAT